MIIIRYSIYFLTIFALVQTDISIYNGHTRGHLGLFANG